MNRLIMISGNNRTRLKVWLLLCKNALNCSIICLILLVYPDLINAAGFAVLEQSVSGLGNAYSGGTAGGEDISTIFYNPAGLSEYAGTEMLTGAHLALPEARLKVNYSSDILNRPLTGGDGGNAGEAVLIPSLYLATDLPGPFRLGLGITVPFGLGTKYDKGWKGRYEAINSQLKTIDINPAISYAFNDKISLGFGLSAQYIDIELSNAIDFGTLCIGQLGAVTCSGMGLAPQAADGELEIKANGWSWGYNAGVLFKPISGMRVGIAYRSKVNYHMNGDAQFQVPVSAKPLTAARAFSNTNIASESDVPAKLSFGVIYETKDKLALLFDLTWTQWSRLDRLTIDFENPSQPSSTLQLDFKNTLRASLGFNYHINPAWTLRTGFAYDESPVRNSRTRTFRIPDSDRYWLTIGAGYRLNSDFKFNFAYAHIFIQNIQIERVDSFGHRIAGSFESQIDIVSAELQWTF